RAAADAAAAPAAGTGRELHGIPPASPARRERPVRGPELRAASRRRARAVLASASRRTRGFPVSGNVSKGLRPTSNEASSHHDIFKITSPADSPLSRPLPHPGTPAAPSASATSNGSGNVVLSMNSLTNDGLLGNGSAPPAGSTTLADKALQNLMGSIDSFGITGSAAKPPAANPFDSGSNLMGNATLGEIKAKTSTGSEKKPVMNTPPGAMVVASGQQGNWGGYGQGGGMQQQQPPQYTMAGGYPQQQQMGYGQPQMGGMQQQPMQQPMQQPPMQGYGQPSMYGQQPPQQGGWGGPSY
ncbi:hypothetical protein THAOC_33753, partial [Thalassiosira oceanica]